VASKQELTSKPWADSSVAIWTVWAIVVVLYAAMFLHANLMPEASPALLINGAAATGDQPGAVR
jgi:hypothetical protein